MQFRKRVTLAGNTMLVEAGPDYRGSNSKPRGKRENPTPEAVARYNEKMAEKRLRLLINANFGPEDYHLTLTYAGEPPTIKDARRCLSNFLRRAKRLSNKQERELKYISVTEWNQHRIHHHVILSGLDCKEAVKLWSPLGNPKFTFLDPSGDYKWLAAYLIKETKYSLRAGIIGKRWSGSKNLKQPTVKEKTIKRWNRLDKTPKEYKHYALMDWETVANPITGELSQWAYYLRIPEKGKEKRRRKNE